MTRIDDDRRDFEPGSVAAALAGRPLVAPTHRTRGWCRRCQRKNDLRDHFGRDDRYRDPTFDDGQIVRLDAVALADTGGRPSPDPPERQWGITAAYHGDHPLRSRGAAARPGVTQARLTATVRAEGWVYQVDPDDPEATEYDPEALVLRDVRVEWCSPQGHGSSPTQTDPRHGEEPARSPGDPRPDWPPAENDWLRRLADESGGDE